MGEAGQPAIPANLQGILKWSLQHTDGTAPAREISEEEKKFFMEAMESATVNVGQRMRMITQYLVTDAEEKLSEEDLEFRVNCLEELQDHVESIDAAGDLRVIGALEPLKLHLSSPHKELRALAAEVLATAAQNNLKAQRHILDAGVLPEILRLAWTDHEASVRVKGLLAVSCLVRHFDPAQDAFRVEQGLESLGTCLALEKDERVRRKALFLAKYLATSQIDHIPAMVRLGYAPAAALALRSADRNVREAALGFLLEVARHVARLARAGPARSHSP